MAKWSDEETDNPLYADHRNFLQGRALDQGLLDRAELVGGLSNTPYNSHRT